MTTPEARPFIPALDDATDTIEGFESPYGLEVLATVDWLHREGGIAMEALAMRAAIRNWPGPVGSAERKARVFRDRDVDVALEHLRRRSGHSAAAGDAGPA